MYLQKEEFRNVNRNVGPSDRISPSEFAMQFKLSLQIFCFGRGVTHPS